MKEITRIHLAKTPYDIEVDAKKALEKYLKAIERAMRDDDVMYEIEARMVELLGEHGVAGGGVITASDVDSLRQQMGEPKEFAGGAADDSAEDDAKNEFAPDFGVGEKPTKRLMRDPDNAMLGGVCSGLAAYFGVDVVWARIAAIILLVVSFGTAVLVYILLCIVMPEAKTAADKLQMRGEPVTLESLRNFSSGEGVSRNLAARSSTVALKIVQIIVAVTLFSTALGLLVALMFGTLAGVSIVMLLDGFSAQPWAQGLLASLIVAGAASVVIAGLLTASAIRWKFGRSTLIAIIVAAVIGALTIPCMALTGTRAVWQFERDQVRLTKTESIELPADLEGVKYYRVEDMLEADLSDGSANASDGKIRAEIKYLAPRGVNKPQISVERQGDTLVVKGDAHCRDTKWALYLGGLDSCALSRTRVKFHGPIQLAPVVDEIEYDGNGD